MIIYKITNTKNNKIYIGQTIKTKEERFKRHIQDALSGRLNTHLANAIRQYGQDNFLIEQIDTAETQEELTRKEIYWIHYYDSINKGYNETDSSLKCGGNTYKNKTEEEMNIIKQKLSKSKIGKNNPNAKRVKCKNIKTNEELFFDSMSEMQNYFNEKNHNFISRRCLGKIKCLYKKEWAIAYADSEYLNFSKTKGNHRAQKIEVTDLNSNIKKEFASYAEAERYYNLSPQSFSRRAYLYKDQKYFIKNNYKIKILN